jgi:hypothetical protein
MCALECGGSDAALDRKFLVIVKLLGTLCDFYMAEHIEKFLL